MEKLMSFEELLSVMDMMLGRIKELEDKTKAMDDKMTLYMAEHSEFFKYCNEMEQQYQYNTKDLNNG